METTSQRNQFYSCKDLFENEFGPPSEEEARGYALEDGNLKVSEAMASARINCGVSQDEMARRLGMSKANLVKLESNGALVKMHDFSRYLAALDLQAEVTVLPRDLSDAQKIKVYFHIIKELVEKLEKLAGTDSVIQKGVLETLMGDVGRFLASTVPSIVEKIAKIEDMTEKKSPDAGFDAAFKFSAPVTEQSLAQM